MEDGSTVVESVVNPKEDEEFYVQIQGSDRKYPAIVLRKKDRGKGATIRTISKYGAYADIYAEYEEAIAKYIQDRKQRLDNSYNTPARDGESATTRPFDEGSPENLVERRLNQALRSALERGLRGADETPEDTV